MSKHIDLSGLKTLLEPLVHLINKKAERPDWNENDPSSPDYIENRPFYTELKTDFLVEQQEIVIDDGLYANLTANATFVVGETYTVVIDGVEYQCVAWQGSDGVCIGNGDIYGGEGLGGDEPFSCDSYDDGSMYLNTLELGTYTISIAGLSEKVHKIDDKYLPEMVGIKGSVVGAEIFNADVNIANGNYSHAEGIITVASGYASHAEGEDVQASGRATHAEGVGTIASGDYQHIQGKYNTEDIACAHIVGNGNSWDDRSNAHTLDWDGNAWFAGIIKVGGTGQYDSAAQEVALKSDLASAGISVDETLTISGAAADAKVTGDAIAGLNELVGDTKVSTQISNAIDGYKPHSLFVNEKPSAFVQPSNSQPFVTLYNESGTRNYAISADASGVGMHAYDENGVWKSYTPMYSALNKPTASELGIKDEKVNIEVRDGTTSNASMSPVGITSTGTGTLNIGLVKYSGIQYNIVNGDASTVGKVQMVLGNNIASGTDGNKQGQISLFSANGMASGKIVQEDKTSSSVQYITHTLPNTGGTLLNTGNYKSYVTPANIGAATADSVSNLNTLVGDTKVSTQISNAVYGLAKASVAGAGTTAERFELRSPDLNDLLLVTKRDGGIFVYDTTKATSVATAYTTANKPTPADIGAAASSHNHGALASGNSTLGIADYTGDVPLMTARYNSKQSFALQQESAGSNNVLLHTYSSTGAWQKGGKILTSNHFSCSLNGTTLTITDNTATI